MEKERIELENFRATNKQKLTELRNIQDKRIAEEKRISAHEDENMRLLHEQFEQKASVAREKLFFAKQQYDIAMRRFKEEEAALESERREHVNQMAEAKSERAKKQEEAFMLERLAKEQEQSAKDVDAQKIVTLQKMREDSDKF